MARKLVRKGKGNPTQTLRDRIMKELCKQGITEAAAVAVTYKDGSTVTIHGDTHPALDRPADNVQEVQTRQTAAGA